MWSILNNTVYSIFLLEGTHTVKIALASDLHLDFAPIQLRNKNAADVLVLAGDIFEIYPLLKDDPQIDPRKPQYATRYKDFLNEISAEFPRIVYVAGNHELYRGKWNKSIADLREVLVDYPNITFLENDSVTIGDVTFVGATLWTDIDKGNPVSQNIVEGALADYRRIVFDDSNGTYRKLRSYDTINRHKSTVAYIKETVAKIQQKCVVVTHHAPHGNSADPKYIGDPTNAAYFSDLSEIMLEYPHIAAWCHGHVHNLNDYTIGNTRVLSNPRGYQGYEQCAAVFKLNTFEI